MALQERGIEAHVFEQAPELTEIGAAIALSANSIREYARLGLTESLAVDSTIPTELIYRHWRSGDRISAHPVAQDGWYEKRFGAPTSVFTGPICRRRCPRRCPRRICIWVAGW